MERRSPCEREETAGDVIDGEEAEDVFVRSVYCRISRMEGLWFSLSKSVLEWVDKVLAVGEEKEREGGGVGEGEGVGLDEERRPRNFMKDRALFFCNATRLLDCEWRYSM
jgi:hypothetical protein